MTPDAAAAHHGENLTVLERVIVAPAIGVFRPLPDGTEAGDGDQMVSRGQQVGTLEVAGRSTPVRSPFAGFLMGMLARPGERVREGQPVAWLRAVGA